MESLSLGSHINSIFLNFNYFFTLYFEIITDPQEVAKVVPRGPVYPSPSFCQW